MLSNSNSNNFDIKDSSENTEKQSNIIDFPEKQNGDIENKYSANYDFKNNKLNNNNIIQFENNKLNKKGNNNLPPKPTIISFLGIIILAFVIWGFTNKNAKEVFLGEKSIGIIGDKKITAEEIQNTSIAKLKETLGTDIKVNEEITLKPVHAAKKEIVSTEHILSEISKEYTFKIEASSIFVNGKEIATLKNEEEAKNVLAKLASKYIKEGDKLASKPTFVESVEIKPEYVEEEEIMAEETAFGLLNVNSSQGKKYTIKSGDTLYQIAIDSDMSLAELLKINPDLSENSMLKIGQEINVVASVPLLSVVTEEQATYTEAIPKKIETVNNDKEYKTYKKVISAGKDGTKEVTAKIRKVNGIEQEKTVISEKVLVEPTVEKIEVGTLKTPPKKAIGNFIYPISGARLTSHFGGRWGRMHTGIDLACASGTPIKASDGGTVVYSGWYDGYGNMVKIDHGNGFETLYGHNSKNAVSVGQKVAQGEIIAYVGNTGRSTGNHLHFEVIKNGVKYNPLNYIK